MDGGCKKKKKKKKKRKRQRITVVDEPAGGGLGGGVGAASAAGAGAEAAGAAAAAAAGRFGRWREAVPDSRALGHDMLGWMLHPMDPQTFFDTHWEQQPALIRRPDARGYYAECFCRRDIEELLSAGKLTFEHDLDITEYTGGKRSTYNGSGVVDAAQAWRKFEQGCSLRMLCPHAHSPKVWHLLSALEHSFGSFVGANTYLTPAGTQGFAPHYDDIEAFVLQLEGAKEWRVYPPISAEETLPRHSSNDFTHADIGEPVLSVTLQAGDLLYFPRGWVHEARSSPGTHSLHLTVSTALRHTWRDLLEVVLPAALDLAAGEDLDFRQTLPPDMREYMGVMHSDADAEGPSADGGATLHARAAFHGKLLELVEKCMHPEALPIDGAVDQLIRTNLRSRLPPTFPQPSSDSKAVTNVSPGALVRLVRHDVAQLVAEEDEVCIYHCASNTNRYQEAEEGRVVIPMQAAPAVEHLINSCVTKRIFPAGF